MKPYRNLRVIARFAPRITDDLEPELASLVGEEAVFSYHAFVDDDDTAYTNQWVLTSEDRRFSGFRFPESDLEILGISKPG
jgi:hypothetical protein